MPEPQIIAAPSTSPAPPASATPAATSAAPPANGAAAAPSNGNAAANPPDAKAAAGAAPRPQGAAKPGAKKKGAPGAAKPGGKKKKQVEDNRPAWLRRLTRDAPGVTVSAIVHAVLLFTCTFIVLPAKDREQIMSLLVSRDADAEATDVDTTPIQPDKIEAQPTEVVQQPVASAVPTTDPIQISEPQPVGKIEVDEGPGSGPQVAKPGDHLGQRTSAESRAAAVKSGGGSEGSEKAVASGLKWLAKMQKPDGHWDFKVPGDEKDGKDVTMANCTSGATSLALLAYLGAGHTHRKGQGDYQETVQKGLDYLVNQMQVTSQGGDLRGKVISHEGMYTQGLAALAICEAFALTKDTRLKKIAKQAMDFIISAQDVKGGGWRYTPGQAGDISVTGWQVMALKSAQLGKIRVPPSTVGKVTFFLNSMQAEGGARYGYDKPQDNNPSMTAVGLLCRMYLGWTPKTPALQKGVEYLAKVGPNPNDMYYNYYATQVLHHWGGETWTKWNLVMRDRLVSSQVRQGDQTGSWPPTDPHANAGGRLYQTCLSVMTLEVYYRHLPLYQREKMSADF